MDWVLARASAAVVIAAKEMREGDTKRIVIIVGWILTTRQYNQYRTSGCCSVYEMFFSFSCHKNSKWPAPSGKSHRQYCGVVLHLRDMGMEDGKLSMW